MELVKKCNTLELKYEGDTDGFAQENNTETNEINQEQTKQTTANVII